jgi:hypothetical protein
MQVSGVSKRLSLPHGPERLILDYEMDTPLVPGTRLISPNRAPIATSPARIGFSFPRFDPARKPHLLREPCARIAEDFDGHFPPLSAGCPIFN